MKEDKVIVTIGRQFCSGGRDVGKALAEKMGVEFYDKELIAIAAKESGYAESLFENADEEPSNSLLYSVVMSTYPMSALGFHNDSLLSNDKLFGIQSKVIKEIVSDKSCVLVGRCSDYILREHPKLVRVFIRADMDMRKERFREAYPNVKEKDIEHTLLKTDKKRSTYYGYYTGNVWDSMNNYDLILNTSKIGIDGAVNQIMKFIEDLK